ncbi:MAG: hypothetical protein GPOALKHO_001116 [Sodalis sp.]|nr:MAG: hypothetical protein GPOALKHO_001116 [Sodalis sp.]
MAIPRKPRLFTIHMIFQLFSAHMVRTQAWIVQRCLTTSRGQRECFSLILLLVNK